MAVKTTGQFSFVDALLPQGVGRNARLERLNQLVRWYRFEKLMKALRDETSAGRPAYPTLILFKALLLQALYGLSDVDLEDALADRLSFRKFIGLGLREAIPDSTTLCRFRNRLVQEELLMRLFGELKAHLGVDEGSGIIRSAIATPANVNDTTPADALIRGDERTVLADAACLHPFPTPPPRPMLQLRNGPLAGEG